MDKILVLGSTGFLGRYLVKELQAIGISRKEADLTDLNSIKTVIRYYKPNVVINCASNPDVSLSQYNNQAYLENIAIFNNLFLLKEECQKFIFFGSGAEFDRRYSIDRCVEKQIFEKNPIDHYGSSKNVIARAVQTSKNNFYNLRLFGCFHHTEIGTRLLKQVSTNSELTVLDRYFDYFYLEDLLTVVKYYIQTENVPNDINLVYEDKIRISQLVELFTSIKAIDCNFSYYQSDNNYTGCGKSLKSLNLPLLGIERGLEKYEI